MQAPFDERNPQQLRNCNSLKFYDAPKGGFKIVQGKSNLPKHTPALINEDCR